MKKLYLSIAALIIVIFIAYRSISPKLSQERVTESREISDVSSTPPLQDDSGTKAVGSEVTNPVATTPGGDEEQVPVVNNSVERPSPVPPDSEMLRGDNALSTSLRTKLGQDSRIKGAAIVQEVVCDGGTCLVSAQAKPSMESEIANAFTLFQRDYPEFGSKFKMEVAPEANGISTFMFAP